MPRKPRIEFPGAVYHVFARGNRKQKVFHLDYDYAKYHKLMYEYKERYKYRIYAFALMPNHVHLLIETGETPLSTVMQGIQQSYTQYYNTKYKQVGHVFQGRYRALLCDKDKYLLELIRYIHLNPVRAKIVEDIKTYTWTGHIDFIRRRPISVVDTDFVLAQFSPQYYEARNLYVRFIADGMHLDSESLKTMLHNPDYEDREKPLSQLVKHEECRQNPIVKPSLEVIEKIICKINNISPSLLRSNSKISPVCRSRHSFCYIAKIIGGHKIKVIAKHLNISEASVSIAVRREDRRIEEEITHRRVMQKLKKELLENY